MEINNFNQKDIIFSLDIGTRSVIGTAGVIKDKKFHVLCEKYIEHEERAMVDGQIHDINLVAKVARKIKNSIEEELNLKLTEVSIAAAGRFLRTIEAKSELDISESDEEIGKDLVRTLELTAMKNAEEEINKSAQGKLYCVGYSVKNYYLNKYLIGNLIGQKGGIIEAEVIATFLPRSVIDSLYSVMDKVDLKVVNLTLEPIAAMEAVIPKKLRLLNIALVDIGAGTSDIAISNKETVSAYGMIPVAGDEVTETIVQEYLVDFNTAEQIKREAENKEEITYTDIMGFENTIKSESVFKVIDNTVKKLSNEICKKIIELNGEKAPSAVFLVGGGAHTPGLIKEMSDGLGLMQQRIGIKDRSAVTECVCDNKLGSAGVTVLGIALSSIRTLGNDFIDVTFNNEPITLFNSHKHTVMDVVLQAGINPKLFIAKNGKSVRFTYNGCRRIAFGEYGKNSVITVNGKKADFESEVRANDKINVEYAQNGKNAEPKLFEHIKMINSISIFANDEIINVEPVILVNENIESADYIIKNNDEIKVFLPSKVGELKKYVIKNDVQITKDEVVLEDDYEIYEGIKIEYEEKVNGFSEILKSPLSEEKINYDENIVKDKETAMDKSIINPDNGDKNTFYKKTSIENIVKDEVPVQNEVSASNGIGVTVNGEKIRIKEKPSYVVEDVFDYIDFDLTVPKGNINITLNGEKISYTVSIKDGDIIEIFWS